MADHCEMCEAHLSSHSRSTYLEAKMNQQERFYFFFLRLAAGTMLIIFFFEGFSWAGREGGRQEAW